MKKLFLLTLAVLMIASAAYGAICGKHVVLFPQNDASNARASSSAVTDTSLAGVSTAAYALNLDEFESFARMSWWVNVTTADTDIDSVSYVLRTSPDGVTWVVVNSDVNTASTVAGTNWTGNCDADSLLRYVQLVARVIGDEAGTAIQTIAITPLITLSDAYGVVRKRIGGKAIVVSLNEVP